MKPPYTRHTRTLLRAMICGAAQLDCTSFKLSTVCLISVTAEDLKAHSTIRIHKPVWRYSAYQSQTPEAECSRLFEPLGTPVFSSMHMLEKSGVNASTTFELRSCCPPTSDTSCIGGIARHLRFCKLVEKLPGSNASRSSWFQGLLRLPKHP